MAPLKQEFHCGFQDGGGGFPSLHRDGPIEAGADQTGYDDVLEISIPSQGWPH